MDRLVAWLVLVVVGIAAAANASNASAAPVQFPSAEPLGWSAAWSAAWSADEVATIQTLRIDRLAPAPLDPSNGVDGNARAIELGKRLFNDERFSSNGRVSCASCHLPDRQFQDGLPVGKGVGTGSRRTMPVVGLAYSPWLFWDGRKDSAWSQALGPLEDGVEHGGNRMRYARLIDAHYRSEYQALFGPMPALADLPQDAGPQGSAAEQAAWSALPRQRRDEVSRVFANLGKAIAAYERTLSHAEARFDKFAKALATSDVAGQQVLTPQEANGLRLFVGKAQCVTCHNGPLLTDQAFHNTGVPQRDRARPDRGRAAALAKVKQDEFNCLGPFSDAKPDDCQELAFMSVDGAGLEAAFKTPSLRNVAQRPPYMHAGQFASLEEVVTHYVQAPAATVGHSELADGKTSHSGKSSHIGKGAHVERKPIRLSAQEIRDVAAFLGTLSGEVVERTPDPLDPKRQAR